MGELPAQDYAQLVFELLTTRRVVIVEGPPGCGKTTVLPEYVMAQGFHVGCTQPRRLAARCVAQRVATLRHEVLGDTVGYQTAYEKAVSTNTRLRFMTDGLALLFSLIKAEKWDVLFIDEVHEWGIPVETLVAWALRQLRRRSKLRVVIMSATLESIRLSHFFALNGRSAPVVQISDGMYPVDEQPALASAEDDVQRLLNEGRQGILVFEPGKREIRDRILALRQRGVDAEIFPLHGDLSLNAQAKCFQIYRRPKIVVSTDVAQTSVTVPGIDAVVDSGLKRSSKIHEGVEGLFTEVISWADRRQRKGRAGRVMPGVYVDRLPEGTQRLEFSQPEIHRKKLSGTILRIKADTQMDIRKLPFFHPPKVDAVNRGCAELLELGCFNEARQTSGLGYKVARLAMLEPRLACMVIEGNDLGIREDVATMAAILEAGGIASRGNQRWRSLVSESRSDLIAQLELWGRVTPLLNRTSNEELEKMGIDVRNLLKAREVRGKLLRELSSEKEGKLISSRREAQELAIIAGFKGLVFVRKGAGWTRGDDQIRILSSESVVSRKAKFILGIPWDLDVRDAQPGEHTLTLIRMATELGVEFVPEPLKKLARKHGKRRKRSGQGEFFRVHSQREQSRGRGR